MKHDDNKNKHNANKTNQDAKPKRRAAHNVPGPGHRLSVRIKRTNDDGHGIGRLKDIDVNVAARGAFPGDTITGHVERRWVKTRQIQVKTKVLEEGGDKRVETRCAHGLACPGCPLEGAHRDYALNFRRERVQGALKRAGIKRDVDWPLATEERYDQRERAKLTAGRDKSGKFRLGLYAPNTHEFQAATQCPYFRPELAKVLGALERAFADAGAKAFALDKAGIKSVHARAYDDGVRILVLSAEPLSPALHDVVQKAFDAGDIVGAALHVDGESSNRIVGGERTTTLGTAAGPPLGGGPPEDIAAFCQSVSSLAHEMYRAAAAHVFDAERPGAYWDAYAGTGGFSRALVERGAKQVVAVESDAVALTTLSAVDAVDVRTQRVEDALAQDMTTPAGLILDPPRRGLGEAVCTRLLALAVEKLVVVFCHPDAIAKDLAVLKSGYEVQRVWPVDLFPGTAQVEAMVFLRRRADGPTGSNAGEA